MARLSRRPGGARHARLTNPRRSELIEELGGAPCCRPSSSSSRRAACDDAVAQCLSDGMRLTTPEERAEIRRRCEEHTEGLPEEELRVLGYGPWVAGLEAGLGSHHAGLIPAFRQAVEDCFSANLLRVVFATETLALGINMPARTVVIERLTKIRDSGRSGLSSGEYAQMTGRAGRRGLDSLGHAVVVWSPQVQVAAVAALATSPPPDLRSSFRPTYNLAVNLVRRYQADQAHFILDRSFAQFLDSRHHHALSQRLDRALVLLERFGARRAGGMAGHAARRHAGGDLPRVRPPHRRGAVRGRVRRPRRPGARRGGLGVHVRDAPGAQRAAVSNPPKALRPRLGTLAALGEALRDAEEGAHLPRTRPPDDGFADAAWRWARGQRLDQVLERAELAPGDFVRNVKQLVDLLRQLAVVGRPATAAAARQAAHLLQRGVVGASAGPASVDAGLDPPPSSDDPTASSEAP